MVTKTEWLSLKLHCETICNLVYQLDSAEEVSLEQRLVLALESECTSMKTMTLALRSQVFGSPIEIPPRLEEVS